MKRIKNLWLEVVSWPNLLAAYRRARCGKQDRPEVARFSFDLEYELRDLQRDLIEGTYHPGQYRLHTIYDRKPRQIAVAPFRDRVLQHALMGVVEPRLDPRFIHDSYACRIGKGVHAAVARFQGFAQRYPYLLKLDVAAYFPSIDHQYLELKLVRMIGDRRILNLFGRIVRSAPLSRVHIPDFPGDDLVDRMRPRGLPIGNLTSQFFGNLYLNDLDHRIKDDWGEPAYLRYVDDLVLFGDSKANLRRREEQVRSILQAERLHVHPRKCWVQAVRHGTEYLGYRVWPHRRRLRADNGYKFRRRLRRMAQRYACGGVSLQEIQPAVAAWIGHAQHGDTDALRKRIFEEQVFARGNGSSTSCGARRFLEQQPSEPAFREP